MKSAPLHSPIANSAMLTVVDVAVLLSCSPRHVRRLCDFGRMPPPVKLGALVRWNRTVIDRWIADGCPPPKPTHARAAG